MRQQIQQSQSCGPNLKSKTQVSIPKTVKTKDLDHEGEKKQKVRGLGWWETHMRRTEWECSKERLASRVRLVAGRVTFLMVLWGRVRVRRWERVAVASPDMVSKTPNVTQGLFNIKIEKKIQTKVLERERGRGVVGTDGRTSINPDQQDNIILFPTSRWFAPLTFFSSPAPLF